MKRILLWSLCVALASCEKRRTQTGVDGKGTGETAVEQSSPAKQSSPAGEESALPLAFAEVDLEKLENAPQWLVEAIANEPAIEHKHLFLYRSTDADHYEVVTSSVPLAELKKGELPGMGAQFGVRRDRNGKAFVGVAEYFHY